jgi:hypothetical protein
MPQPKARLIKRGLAVTASKPANTSERKPLTEAQIRDKWLAERQVTTSDTAALRRKLFGR